MPSFEVYDGGLRLWERPLSPRLVADAESERGGAEGKDDDDDPDREYPSCSSPPIRCQ